MGKEIHFYTKGSILLYAVNAFLFYLKERWYVMARLKYDEERFSKVQVCGIECEFSDMRIDRGSILEGKFLYEVAGNDESGMEPVRIKLEILVNFFGTIIADV